MNSCRTRSWSCASAFVGNKYNAHVFPGFVTIASMTEALYIRLLPEEVDVATQTWWPDLAASIPIA